jgi:hypothetical protein
MQAHGEHRIYAYHWVYCSLGFVYVLFRVDANEHDLTVLIPPMAILAAFSIADLCVAV